MNDISDTSDFRPVARSQDIPDDFVVPLYVGDRKLRISIARVNGFPYAFTDLCTCSEQACPLSGGRLEGSIIMCQCHGSRFDVTDGTVVSGPAVTNLTVFEVREHSDQVYVRL